MALETPTSLPPLDAPTLLSLPTHILLDILSYLSDHDLVQVLKTSRDLCSAAKLSVVSLAPSARPNNAITKTFPSLQRIDFSDISPADWRDSILQGLQGSQHLSSLTLGPARPFSTTTARCIASLHPSLKSLDISESIINGNSSLDQLTTLSGLNSLSLRGCLNSTTTDIAFVLQNLPSLEEVDLGGCHGIDDSTLQALGTLPLLRKCDIASCDHFSALGLQALCRGALQLRTLLMPACWQLNDECMHVIATHAVNLECLSLFEGGEMVTDEGLACLTALTALTCLDLGYSCWAHTSTGLQMLLTRHPQLQLLNVGGTEGMRDEVLCELLKNPPTGLTSLDVSECQRVTAEGMKHLALLPRLQELNAGWNLRLTDEALRGLLAPSLTKLDLSYCADLTDKALQSVASSQLTSLRHLILRRCGRLTDQGLTFLANGNAPLTILDISHCHSISSAGIKALSSLKTLSHLTLAGCPRATTVLSLAALATFSPQLRSLDASHNPRLDDGCLNSLSFVSQLRCIVLKSCPRISDRGLIALGRITKLEYLNVRGCRGLSYQGACKLKEKLPLLRGGLLGKRASGFGFGENDGGGGELPSSLPDSPVGGLEMHPYQFIA